MRAMQRGKLAYARSRQTMRACICRGERAQVGRDHGMQPIDLALARTFAEATCLRASAGSNNLYTRMMVADFNGAVMVRGGNLLASQRCWLAHQLVLYQVMYGNFYNRRS